MKLRCIIVDDEKHCQQTLEKQLEWLGAEIKIEAKCFSVEEAKVAIKKYNPDLVFLDIEMPEKNGFDLLYESNDISFDVIFVTAYDEFAIQAFKTNAIAYLLKPVDRTELKEALEKLQNSKEKSITQEKLMDLYKQMNQGANKYNKVAFPTSEGIEFIDSDDIIRIEAEGNYVHIVLSNQKNLFIAKTLKQIEDLVSSHQFIRPHNSHLVNMHYVKSYQKGSGGSLTLEDGTMIPVSRYRKEAISKLY